MSAPTVNDSSWSLLYKIAEALNGGDSTLAFSSLGVGGANDGTQAPLQIFNNSLALSESASLTSTRLCTLTGNVASINHRVIDAGMHANLASYTLAYAEGSYGGLYVNSSPGGGTLTYGGGLKGYVQTDTGATVTEVNCVRAQGAVSGTSIVTDWYSFKGQVDGVVGTLTNYYGVSIADVTAGTFTAAFHSLVNSAATKWALYMGGTAKSYIRGTLLVGNSTDNANGALQLPASASATTGIGFGADCNLYRTSANVLRTDDSLQCGGDVTLDNGSEYKFGTSGARGKLGASADGAFYLRNTASTAPGMLRAGRNVQTKTADYTITALEAGDETWSNSGAAGTVILTLPTGTNGMRVRAVVLAAQQLRLFTGTAVQIRNAASLSTATTGYIQSNTVGNVVTLEYISGVWVVVNIIGTWTVV